MSVYLCTCVCVHVMRMYMYMYSLASALHYQFDKQSFTVTLMTPCFYGCQLLVEIHEARENEDALPATEQLILQSSRQHVQVRVHVRDRSAGVTSHMRRFVLSCAAFCVTATVAPGSQTARVSRASSQAHITAHVLWCLSLMHRAGVRATCS